MAKIETTCEVCGKVFARYPSQLKRTNFCSRECLQRYNSEHFSPYVYRRDAVRRKQQQRDGEGR